jgi:iron complex outermembrane recepter protein
MKPLLLPLLSSVCLALLAPDPAAQGAPSSPPVAPSTLPASEEIPALPDTVVTARKWKEEAQKVPQSLFVFDEEDLGDAGIESMRDASFLVPNLFLNEFSSRRLSFPTMRGIGSGQGDPAVTTYIDGVPQLSTSSTNLALLDIERIEFLRGPQSTLYGRNALGGIIHIIPRSPSLTREFDAGYTFGNHGLQEFRAAGGGALVGDDLLFRLSVLDASRDGYTTNDFTGHDVDFRDAFSTRGSLLWAPADEDWDLRLALHTERSRDGGFVLSDLEGLRDRPHHLSQDFEGRTERDLFAPAVTWTYHGDEVEVTSVSAFQDLEIYGTADFDFSIFDLVRRETIESLRYFNQEIRVSSAGDEAGPRWLVGVNFFTAESERSGATEFRPGVPPPMTAGIDTASGEFDDWGAALFAQATVRPVEKIDLGLGVRFDHEDKEVDLRRTFEMGGMTVSDDRLSLDEDYDEFVPQVSLSREMTENTLAYLSFARSFKAGGFNLTAPTGSFAFEPETSWTWEVGTKTSWFEDRLQWNFAAFHIDWEDMQLSLFDAAVGGFVDNAGEATSMGFETELRARPRSGLEVFAGFGYTDTEFDEYVDVYGTDVSGNSLAFAPETTWSLGTTLSGGPDEEHRWFLHGEVTGVGTYYFDAGNREDESYTLLNFRAGVARPHWRLEAFVRNAFDEEYVTVAFQPNPADPTAFVGECGTPLTCGISLTGTL